MLWAMHAKCIYGEFQVDCKMCNANWRNFFPRYCLKVKSGWIFDAANPFKSKCDGLRCCCLMEKRLCWTNWKREKKRRSDGKSIFTNWQRLFTAESASLKFWERRMDVYNDTLMCSCITSFFSELFVDVSESVWESGCAKSMYTYMHLA